MYPFNINSTQNPISFDGQSNQHRPLFKNDNYPINSEFFHLPSPQQYEDAVFELTWQQLHDLFFHQTESNMENLKRDDNDDDDEQFKQDDHQLLKTTDQKIMSTVPRKRNTKKDRHSKITTASGLRDRRMRLSLPVARKFFGLQDMLGFDKASKTIEWLLTQSNSAIQQTSMKFLHHQPQGIRHDCSSLSSTSECISGNIAESDYNDHTKTNTNLGVKTKIAKNARRTAFARESRKFARERARKRTMEKKRKLTGEINSDSLGGQYFGSGTQNASKIISPLVVPLEGMQEVQYLSSLVISSNWNTSALCNFDQNDDITIQQHEYGSSLWY